MDSLYGGHQGVSFVLKGRYESIDAMIRAFKGGSAYTIIHYGEYVIIDTPNKNDFDNGKIYRRGYDYQNKMGGAEYIGQIVGPSSGTPYFQINNLENTKKEAQQEADNEKIYKRYPTGLDEGGHYIVSADGDGSDIETFDMTTKDVLVPGKIKDEETWNDTIKYTWVNIRDVTNAADSWFYVGFEIPYMVIDYNTKSISPYDEEGNRLDGVTSQRTDDYTHPFWEEWELGIPKGIKGDTLRHLHIIIPEADDIIYDIDKITTSIDENGEYITDFGEPGYEGQQDDIDNRRQILVIEYTVYDQTEKGKTGLIYVGKYNIINFINVEDDGTLIVGYTHDDDVVFTKKIKWVTDATITDDGIIEFVLNTGDIIRLQDEGKDFHLKFIEDVKLETEIHADKHIKIKYNTNEDYVDVGDSINYIQDMVVRTYDWHLLVLYTDPNHRYQDDENIPNTAIQDQYGNRWINSIKGSDGTIYDDDIYWKDMGTIKDQAGIMVGFNVSWDDVIGAGSEDILSYLNEQFPQGLTGDEQYPGGPSTQGKVVTYSADPNGRKEFYAYDYNKNEWYFLGFIDGSGTTIYDAAYLTSTDEQDSLLANMRTGGIMLVPTDNITIGEIDLPIYWNITYDKWA